MKVLFDVLRALVDDAFVFIREPLIDARVCETKIKRARKRFPHFAPKTVGQADLDEARALRIAQKSEVTTVC